MAIISVEVPDEIAEKIAIKKIISIDTLYEELDTNAWKTIVDFGKEGVPVSEVLSYLKDK